MISWAGLFVAGDHKIWDIAGALLMLKKVGGILTDFNGDEIEFDLTTSNYARNYSAVRASLVLHKELMKIVKQSEAS